ncbi:MAG: prephenate dehydrogenase/arogenate dehydrogenase family protein [Spirochaetaceae bacterium]|nr:MAG: prephenate dehydrogenase/arogenate dehydrogenase family protein [Spirochaetaceae bacterium]
MKHDFGVYGLGRFGVFWADLLSRFGAVKVFSRSKKENLPPGLMPASEAEVLSSEALFFCVSISSFTEVLKRTAGSIKPPTTVFDTCSVKVFPAKKMDEMIPSGVEIIATHPMFGPDSAKNGIRGLPIVFAPVRAKQETANKWKTFFDSMGLSVIQMSPEEHDREAAFTQGITHYIGRVLADLKLEPSVIATLGYKKLLEIVEQTCNDPWQLFLDIQNYNPYTREMREKLHRSLEKIYSNLDQTLDTR